MSPDAKPPYSLWQLVSYALKLGAFGFGGPVALVGYMHRDLVEQRKWISEADYKEGLTLAQLAPGPLAAQLAIYLGYVDYRIAGATLVGIAFVLPSFVMVVALGMAYIAYRWAHLDAGGVLRRGRRGHRDHRDQRLQAHDEEHRSGQTALGDLPRQRGCHDQHPDRSVLRQSRAFVFGSGLIVPFRYGGV